MNQKTNRRSVGTVYENLAAEMLKKKGYRIECRNYRCHFGEIDIIGSRENTLVFFEVKYRHSRVSGYAASAVSFYKQRAISRTADYYLMKNRIPCDTPCRFDILAFDGAFFRHYENAFDYIPQ